MSTADQKNILLVEDDALIALGQKSRLENYGYHVEIVNSGEKAVGKMRENPAVDLILMDINLGKGMDGTEAAGIILKDHEIPIVFLSSHTEPEIVEKTEKITSYGYVVKDSGTTVLDASIKMAFKLFDANHKLRESENRLADLIFSSSDWVWEVDQNGVYTYSSQKGTDILGRSREQIIGKTPFDFMAPEEARRVSGILAGIMADKAPIRDLENWNIGATGERICLITNGVPIMDRDGNLAGYRGVDKDITARKLGEEKLAVIRNAVEAASDAIGISDAEGGHFYQNRALTELFGYADAEELQAAGGGSAVVRDPAVAKEMFGNIMGGKPWAGELEMVTKSGRVFPAFERADAIKDGDGKVIGLIGIITDMTERNRNSDLLRRSEEKLRNTLIGTKAGTWEWNIQTGEDFIDEASASLLGYSLAELQPNTYETWMALKHPDDRKMAQELVTKHVRGETEFYSFESRARHKNGGWVWILGRGKVIEKDGEGKPLRMFGTYIDITERKLVEEALKESETKYRSLIEFSSDVVFCVDLNGVYQFTNKAFAATFGKTPADFIGKTFWDAYPKADADLRHEIVKRVFETGNRESFEIEVPAPDKVLYFTSTSNPIKDENGTVILCLTHGTDISDRRRIEISLKESERRIGVLLGEKEILLKEVHHRIKNNMGTMISLLSLQSGILKEPSAIQALEDAENRLRSMEVLYDKLYRSQDFRELSAADYLPALVQEIVAVFPNCSHVQAETRIDDIALTAELLSPLGIIVNEIITNSMKYAFVGREKGLIRVCAAKKDNLVSLTIEDDGVGIPEGIGIDNSQGFGLILIGNLTDQLKGRMRIERGEGTRFVLEFEV